MNPKELMKSLPGHGMHNDGEEYESPFKRSYIGWSPHGDAMMGKSEWWQGGTTDYETWCTFWMEFRDCDLDMNLICDFYFEVDEGKDKCETCDGQGYNYATLQIYKAYYRHLGGSYPGAPLGWSDSITEDEVDVLWEENRLMEWRETGKPTAEQVNVRYRTGMGHDSINCWILVETRAKRLGVWGKCKDCEGEGEIKHRNDKLVLNLWMMHPRKGASKGIRVGEVQETDLSEIKSYLMTNFNKHRDHFSWVNQFHH